MNLKFKNSLNFLRGLSDLQKKIILWAVVGVLGLIMVAFWFNSAAKKVSDIASGTTKTDLPFLNLPSLNITQTDTTAETADLPVQSQQATEGWKTYTNDKFNYSFQYPNSVVLLTSDTKDTGPIELTPATNTSNYVDARKGGNIVFSMGKSNLLDISLDKVSQGFSLPKEDISLVPVKIASTDGYEVIFENKTNTMPDSYFTNIISGFYYIKENDKIFLLTALKNDEVANKMISTFKFIP